MLLDTSAQPPHEPALAGPLQIDGAPQPQPVPVDQPATNRSFAWTLVAWPGLLAAAQAHLGRKFACPFCGRLGLIAVVIALAEWRQRHVRRGVG
jgi:hypothetical protein